MKQTSVLDPILLQIKTYSGMFLGLKLVVVRDVRRRSGRYGQMGVATVVAVRGDALTVTVAVAVAVG